MVWKNGKEEGKCFVEGRFYRLFFGESINRQMLNWNNNCISLRYSLWYNWETWFKYAKGFQPVDFFRPYYVWRVREKKKSADLPTAVLNGTCDNISANYNEPITTKRHEFNNTELLKSNNKTWLRSEMIPWKLLHYGFIHLKWTRPDWEAHIFSSEGHISIPLETFDHLTKMVFTTSGYNKAEDGYVLIMELLNTVHRVSFTNEWGTRCLVRHCSAEHSASLLSSESFKILRGSYGYPPREEYSSQLIVKG